MLTHVPPNTQAKIPAAWMSDRAFITVRLVFNETTGKYDKLPCDFYGNVIDAHDPTKWLTPEELFRSPILQNKNYGVGVIIADGRFCIDLDYCIDRGKLTPLAEEVLAQFPGAYTETSQSGSGKHIFGKAEIGPHRTRVAGLELYTRKRFILLTGTDAQGDAGIDFSAALGGFADRYGLRLTAAELAAPDVQYADVPRPGSTGVFLTDAELIDVMCRSDSGAGVAFGDKVHPRDLWEGNAAAIAAVMPQAGRPDGCPFDRTRAEGRLIAQLMFYTGGHESRAAALFERSALFRPGVHDGKQAYKLTRALGNAAARLTRFYDRPVAVASPTPAAQPVGLPDPWEAARAVAAASWGVPGAAVAATVALPYPIAATTFVQMAPPPRQWTVDGLIPHEQVTLFSGDGGTGKTTLMLMLAMASGSMVPWLGKPVHPRRVLFVSGEDELTELHFRVAQIAKAMGVDGSNVFIISYESLESAELVTGKRFDRLTKTALLEHIANVIRQLGISMVILDPVADLFGGDEIDKRQVKQFISILRREIAIDLKCTVLLSAHPSVDAMKTGRGYSGSTAWNNSVRSRLYFTFDEDDADCRVLEHAKANRGAKAAKIKMRWEKGIFVTQNETVENVELTEAQIDSICREIDRGINQEYDRTFKWAGHAVAKVMGIDLETSRNKKEKARKQIARIISHMLEQKIIETTEQRVPHRQPIMIYRRVINEIGVR